MTNAQVEYLKLLETQRSNRVREQETNRANLAVESETARHNQASEQLTHESTVANAAVGTANAIGKMSGGAVAAAAGAAATNVAAGAAVANTAQAVGKMVLPTIATLAASVGIEKWANNTLLAKAEKLAQEYSVSDEEWTAYLDKHRSDLVWGSPTVNASNVLALMTKLTDAKRNNRSRGKENRQ